jgi:hypothetical protein
MTYTVIADFRDLRDNGYEYKSGDIYPHSGTADPDRAKHLMTSTPQRGPLIEEVIEEINEEVIKKAKPVTKKKQEK